MKEIVVSGAAIMKNNELFVAQRPDRGEVGLKWEFPGGKIEPGESPEAAIVREIKEELDAEIVVESLITVVKHQYSTFHLTMYLFKCYLTGKDPVIKEHINCKWLNSSELADLDWAPADYKVLDCVRRTCFGE